MELRLLVRVLAIAAAALTVLALVFHTLLYLLGLGIGIATLIIYRKTKPQDVRPYFYLALLATIVAGLIFIVQGCVGFIQLLTS